MSVHNTSVNLFSEASREVDWVLKVHPFPGEDTKYTY